MHRHARTRPRPKLDQPSTGLVDHTENHCFRSHLRQTSGRSVGGTGPPPFLEKSSSMIDAVAADLLRNSPRRTCFFSEREKQIKTFRRTLPRKKEADGLPACRDVIHEVVESRNFRRWKVAISDHGAGQNRSAGPLGLSFFFFAK